MPVIRPMMMSLEGLDDEDSYRISRETFSRSLLDQPVIDPLGRKVLFTFGRQGDPDRPMFCEPMIPPSFDTRGRLEDRCHHVCFKESESDRRFYTKIPRDQFRRYRAERIPWIIAALTDPETRIRYSPTDKTPDGQTYLLQIKGGDRNVPAEEFFMVVVRDPTGDSVRFVTSYPVDRRDLDSVQSSGQQIYPVKVYAKKRRRR